MPEIAEVARIVHFLRESLVGKTLSKVVALDDSNVFGKVGTSGPAFEKALTGRKVVGAGQQGKYFWLIMDKPPHPVMHFGMTGWIHIKGQETYYYKPDASAPAPVWPPKFWKFQLTTADSPPTEVAYSDARRFGRVRLVDCDGAKIRQTTPLKENGPDPVVDRDLVTLEWFTALMGRKNVPVKALLLDQSCVSGVGNWVGDEILYHASLHPEQYTRTFSPSQIATLHASLLHITKTAVDLLGDSDRFPNDWLFKHRWGKGKKDSPTTLPTGEKIVFMTVGGRTSCVVPSVQKKTGPVAGDVENGEKEDGTTRKEAKKEGKAKKVKKEDLDDEAEEEEEEEEKVKEKPKPNSKKRKADPVQPPTTTKDEKSTVKKSKPNGTAAKEKVKVEEAPTNGTEDAGRRRSGRTKK